MADLQKLHELIPLIDNFLLTRGTDETITYYVYGTINGVEGFYRAAGITVPAGKAVLRVETDKSIKFEPIYQ